MSLLSQAVRIARMMAMLVIDDIDSCCFMLLLFIACARRLKRARRNRARTRRQGVMAACWRLIDRGYQPAVPLPWFSIFVPGRHSSTCRLENAMMVPASVILKIYVY